MLVFDFVMPILDDGRLKTHNSRQTLEFNIWHLYLHENAGAFVITDWRETEGTGNRGGFCLVFTKERKANTTVALKGED
jgi:hypothetical protein